MIIYPLLTKILQHPTLYQPSQDEQPTLSFILKQGFVFYVKREWESGYHITLNGILYLREKEKHETIDEMAV